MTTNAIFIAFKFADLLCEKKNTLPRTTNNNLTIVANNLVNKKKVHTFIINTNEKVWCVANCHHHQAQDVGVHCKVSVKRVTELKKLDIKYKKHF